MHHLKIAADFACRLSVMPEFRRPVCDDYGETYTIYTAVPLSVLGGSGLTPAHDFPAAPAPILDLLICQGCKVLLCILFGQAEPSVAALFEPEGVLHGLDQVLLPADAVSESCFKAHYQAIRSHLYAAEAFDEPEEQPSPFTLTAVPLSEVISQNAPANLKTCKLLSPDGTITPEGSQYGLLQSADNHRPVYFVASRAIRSLLERVFAPPTLHRSCVRPTLESRLSRLKSGVPGDDLAAAHIVACLQQLLDAPLNEPVRLRWKPLDSQQNGYEILQRQLSQARALLPETAQSEHLPQTFGDVLRFVRTVYEYTASHAQDRFVAEDRCKEILLTLCLPAMAQKPPKATGKLQPLHQRLGTAQCDHGPLYAALAMPIRHYVYGACILQKSVYPDQAYRHQIRCFLYNPEFPEAVYTPLHFLRCALDMSSFADAANQSESFHLLYELLVQMLSVDESVHPSTRKTGPQCSYF